VHDRVSCPRNCAGKLQFACTYSVLMGVTSVRARLFMWLRPARRLSLGGVSQFPLSRGPEAQQQCSAPPLGGHLTAVRSRTCLLRWMIEPDRCVSKRTSRSRVRVFYYARVFSSKFEQFFSFKRCDASCFKEI
jgi:hypothetical protein